jgi:dihydropteroate synthase
MTDTQPMKRYFMPRGLLFGRDAREAIAARRAGALGGHTHIAFNEVEIITRFGSEIERRYENYHSAREIAVVRNITAPRTSFGGIGMDRCRIMGIVNVTPDSFSDGGKLETAQAGIRHGKRLAEEGADILDVGGESTRPGSDEVSVDDELARIIPVIEGLAGKHLMSADTRKAPVMAAALKAGASIINDVSALGHDPDSLGVVAKADAPVILMHAQGQPKTMQLNPRYENVLLDVYDSLRERIDVAVAAGIAREHLCVDPGIGFGKTFKQNLELMAGLSLFHGLGVPLLVGLSRKSVVGAVTGEKVAAKRVSGSVGGALAAVQQGAHILRVHDVAETRHGLEMFTASADPDSVDV